MQSLTEQCTKLERMVLHFSQEQERYFEPLRQEKLHRTRNIFYSEPTFTEAEREGEAAARMDQEMIESECRL